MARANSPKGRMLQRACLAITLVFASLFTIAHAYVPNYSLVIEYGQQKVESTVDQKQGKEIHPLYLGQKSSQEMKGGDTHYYSFKLDVDQYIEVIINQNGIDVVVAAYAPNNSLIMEVDRTSGSRGPEALSLIAENSGDYYFQIQALDKSAPRGFYDIRIKELRSPTPDDQTRMNAQRIVTEGEKLFERGTADSLRESINRYEQSLSLWKSLGDRYEQSLALYGLGWSYNSLASEGLVKLPLPLYRIRWSYESVEEYNKAIQCFKEALGILRELNDVHGQAITETGIAWSYFYKGENDEAYSNFAHSLQLHRSSGNIGGQAIALYGLGWSQAISEEYESALDSFLQSLPLREAVNNSRGIALTLSAIGKMYYRLGKNDEALSFFKRALDLFRQFRNRYAEADALSNLGWVHDSLGNYDNALTYFHEALPLRLAVKDTTGQANTLYGIARIKAKQGDLLGACNDMSEVLNLIEPFRDNSTSEQIRTYYFSNVQAYYDFYVDTLMRLHQLYPSRGYSALAFGVNERAHARELLDILTESRIGRPIAANPSLEQIRPKGAAEIQQLLDRDTVLLEFALGEERSYLWALTVTSITSFELPKRKIIEDHAQQIYESLTARNKYKPNETTLERRTRLMQSDSQYSSSANTLSRILFEGVAPQLGTKRLLIVAQDILQYIPFAALPIPNSKAQGHTIATPLITAHEIVNLPSASTLAVLRAKQKESSIATKILALFADPVFTKDDPRLSRRSGVHNTSRNLPDTQRDLAPGYSKNAELLNSTTKKLPRLVSTRWEAEEVSSLIPSDERLLALDFAANRKAVMSSDLRKYRIIHFATHALIDDAYPDLSSIVLSQFNEDGEPQDGLLRLPDVYKMQLTAELVVLSACNTGLGKEIRGEGLIGMTRGFMHAGVPRVIASLWALNDKSTAELMVKFYKKMFGAEHLSPAAALRSAQIEMWNDGRWQSPYFWAGLILQGDWKWNGLQ